MGFKVLGDGGVATPVGFQAAGIVAGLKRSGAPDMALIHSTVPATVAGAFTTNAFAAAPVVYDQRIIATGGDVRSVIVNSGNANACTGAQGDADATAMAAHVAEQLGVTADEVLVSSTGRIGVPMPMGIILSGIEKAAAGLDSGDAASAQVAAAIMTTDTRPKALAVELTVAGRTVRIGGMTKGAGMINPAMQPQPPQATMLAYVTTDAAVSRGALDICLGRSLDQSFNRITVDGDTSTNDTFLALANGLAGNETLQPDSPDFPAFAEAFAFLVGRLAKEMVLDGEGVTRFVELNVTGAKDDDEARICAEAIANSALCKTAWFGADPNWGRVLCAAGYSGVALDTKQVSLDYQDVPIVRGGMDAGTPEVEQVKAISRREFRIDLDLGVGDGAFTVWTCDLTYEYVKINADYHT